MVQRDNVTTYNEGEMNAIVPVVERIKLQLCYGLCYGSGGEAQEHVTYLVRPEVPLPDEANFAHMVRIGYGGGVYQPWALGWPGCWYVDLEPILPRALVDELGRLVKGRQPPQLQAYDAYRI